MTLEVINDMIQDIEQSDNSLSNARSLASLYILKSIKENDENLILKRSSSIVTKELDDILPSYNYYIDTKRRFQLKQLNEELVIEALKDVCREIKEFVQIIYSCTDMPIERDTIKEMLSDLNKQF